MAVPENTREKVPSPSAVTVALKSDRTAAVLSDAFSVAVFVVSRATSA